MEHKIDIEELLNRYMMHLWKVSHFQPPDVTVRLLAAPNESLTRGYLLL